jgi:hypothetical protein
MKRRDFFKFGGLLGLGAFLPISWFKKKEVHGYDIPVLAPNSVRGLSKRFRRCHKEFLEDFLFQNIVCIDDKKNRPVREPVPILWLGPYYVSSGRDKGKEYYLDTHEPYKTPFIHVKHYASFPKEIGYEVIIYGSQDAQNQILEQLLLKTDPRIQNPRLTLETLTKNSIKTTLQYRFNIEGIL